MPAAEHVLITDWCQQYPSHSVGDLAFGADGALYVSGGDGASFNFADYGQAAAPLNPCGDPPGRRRHRPDARRPPRAAPCAARTCAPTGRPDRRSTARSCGVDPDTGAGLPGNPFSGSADANARRIIAYGLRNPFRFTIRPGTDEVWSGDVGWNDWEEINRHRRPRRRRRELRLALLRGRWPPGGYDGANLEPLREPVPPGRRNVVGALLRLQPRGPGGRRRGLPDRQLVDRRASDFYQAGTLPGLLRRRALLRRLLPRLHLGDARRRRRASRPRDIQTFDPGAANPVDLEIGPQGDLFYADFDGGTIRRIVYTAGNPPPNAVADRDPSSGAAPLDRAARRLRLQRSRRGLRRSARLGPRQRRPVRRLDPVSALTGPTRPGHTRRCGSAIPTEPRTRTRSRSRPTTPRRAPRSTRRPGPPHGRSATRSASRAAPPTPSRPLPASAFDWQVVINHCPSNCHEHTAETVDEHDQRLLLRPRP